MSTSALPSSAEANGGEQQAPPVEKGVVMASLKDEVNAAQVECLNQAAAHPVSSVFNDDDSYLESDCDEQLIITVGFNQSVRIQSLRMRCPELSHAPKTIKLFTNRTSTLDFDDAESLDAVQELALSEAQVTGGAPIELRFVKFQNVNSITIFVADNHGDEDTTRIQYIDFVGCTRESTNMSDFKRVAGKEGEGE